jgi:hypothetical protein
MRAPAVRQQDDRAEDIGRPQNFVSRSFCTRRYFTCAVSFGGAIGAISWSIEILTSPVVAASRRIFTGLLYRFPGFDAHRCPRPDPSAS